MPIPYAAPLADMRFVLGRLLGVVDMETADAVLDEAAKIAGEIFAPLNEAGDRQGAKFEGGRVTMPPGFREAYRAFTEGGWNGLPVAEEHGGQGLPWLLAIAVQEMMQAANIGLALCGLLNQGAIELLAVHGDEELKRKFLPKLVSGDWAGTMNLTEPQAGSDVGAVKTKAVKDGGIYRIAGQKIFISYGDHDLTENILHLVLARLPDAPAGTRGLSLFLVPKILVNDDGSLGKANDVRVVSIEHKLGQHVSPTCVMAYGDSFSEAGGGAVGYLVGQEGGGISAMFTMMNNARISVGVQGLGLMERAYQQARDFARIRVQSRPVENPKAEPVTIIHHPDVRRMLLSMKAHNEAARALAYACAWAVDAAKQGDDAAALRVDLLTPIVKGWLTDLANEMTSTGVQVFGGMGYIEETGAAQHLRDARILAIYEGTNGIQANDLAFRKLGRDGGAAFGILTGEVEAFLAGAKDFPDLREALADALRAAKESAAWLLQNVKIRPALAAAGAAPFLRLCGNLLGGYYLLRMAVLAQEDIKAGNGEATFLEGKIFSARFFAAHVLPQNRALAEAVRKGGEAVAAMPETAF